MRRGSLKKRLDKKYECYILIGQEEEFEEDQEMHLKCFTMGMQDMLYKAFEDYKPFMESARSVINAIDAKKDEE